MNNVHQEAMAKRPMALTAEQKRLVRELVEDEGNTRAQAVAWVLAFHPALAAQVTR